MLVLCEETVLRLLIRCTDKMEDSLFYTLEGFCSVDLLQDGVWGYCGWVWERGVTYPICFHLRCVDSLLVNNL